MEVVRRVSHLLPRSTVAVSLRMLQLSQLLPPLSSATRIRALRHAVCRRAQSCSASSSHRTSTPWTCSTVRALAGHPPLALARPYLTRGGGARPRADDIDPRAVATLPPAPAGRAEPQSDEEAEDDRKDEDAAGLTGTLQSPAAAFSGVVVTIAADMPAASPTAVAAAGQSQTPRSSALRSALATRRDSAPKTGGVTFGPSEHEADSSPSAEAEVVTRPAAAAATGPGSFNPNSPVRDHNAGDAMTPAWPCMR
jgi:hypothetical protein